MYRSKSLLLVLFLCTNLQHFAGINNLGLFYTDCRQCCTNRFLKVGEIDLQTTKYLDKDSLIIKTKTYSVIASYHLICLHFFCDFLYCFKEFNSLIMTHNDRKYEILEEKSQEHFQRHMVSRCGIVLTRLPCTTLMISKYKIQWMWHYDNFYLNSNLMNIAYFHDINVTFNCFTLRRFGKGILS